MEVLEKLEQLIRHVLNDDSIVLNDETTAHQVEGWDSLAHITFMYAIEYEFDIAFDADEFSNVADIGRLRQLIESKLGMTTGG